MFTELSQSNNISGYNMLCLCMTSHTYYTDR